jgi:hypothetical protein
MVPRSINVSQLKHSGSGEPYRIAICGGESTEPWPEPTAPVEAGLREKAMDLVGRSYEEAGLRPQPDLEVDITPPQDWDLSDLTISIPIRTATGDREGPFRKPHRRSRLPSRDALRTRQVWDPEVGGSSPPDRTNDFGRLTVSAKRAQVFFMSRHVGRIGRNGSS